MAEEKLGFHRVVREDDKQGNLKMELSVVLSTYDTSKMEGYIEGSKAYKGFTCAIATLKPNKQHPKSRIDIDPSNEDIRKAIFEMYSYYDKNKNLIK